MKRTSISLLCALAAMSAGSARLAAQATPAEMATWRKAADNRIYAQKLVNETMAHHPDLIVIGLHATPPGGSGQRMIASNLDRIGKKDDDDDIGVAAEHKTVCGPNLKETWKYEVLMPMKDSRGQLLPAALGLVFRYHAGDDEVRMHARAVAIRDEIARQTPDLAALFKPIE